jgi:hypothetical protein
MRLQLVVFLITFCYNLSALSALVVDARALDFVHAKLTGLYVALAVFALFRLFRFNHLNY